MKTITSTQNPEIKKITQLHTSKGRREHQLFIAEGTRIISGFLENKFIPVQIYTTQELLETTQELLTTHNNNHPEHFLTEQIITLISSPVLKKISTHKSPSGILALFTIPSNPEPATINSGIVLANITDPGNMGTLIRTAAALNKKTIITIDGTDPWSPKVIQASAGTISLVTIFNLSCARPKI